MKFIPQLIRLVAILVVSYVFMPRGYSRGETFATKPFIYGQEHVSKFLKKSGLRVEVVSAVRRNASGTELFVYLFDSSTNRFSVIRITTNGLFCLTGPGREAVPGRDGSFVAWAGEGENVIQFQNGQSLQLPRFGLFDIDPGGTYFVIGEKPNTAWLGRVHSPQKRQAMDKSLLPGGIFVSDGKIYLTGHTYKKDANSRAAPCATCLVLKDEGARFEVIESLEFDWAEAVVEVDPFAARLLLWDKALVSHTVYLYDLTTKKRRNVGRVKGFEFFLVADLLK